MAVRFCPGVLIVIDGIRYPSICFFIFTLYFREETKRDELMLEQVRYGKEFEQLFKNNYTRLYRVAFQYLNDVEQSKDMVHDAFEYLWENYAAFRKQDPVAILFRRLRTKSIDVYRHSRVAENYASLYLREANEIEDVSFGEEEERIVRLYKVLGTLPQQTRRIMEECFFNRKKYAEVAEMLNISSSAVKKHVMKALRLLREEFDVKNTRERIPENEI